MSLRLEAQDEKARAELTLGRRRTKGTNNRARARRSFLLDEMDPPRDERAMRPHIFGERLA